MKKSIIIFLTFVSLCVFSQAPQYLNYQGVARNSSGVIITTAIGVKFEILQGSSSGTVVYDETNTITPSTAGIFTTAIGSGAPGIGTFSAINWANGPYFIRVNIDPAGGTSYSTVGTSQLLSVPYALYAEKAGNVQTLTAGNGITINSGTITNTSPNQTVNISGTAVTGSYPNYTVTTPAAPTASTGISISGGTITNTAPDQTVTLASAGISSVTGTYPSYTIGVPPPALSYTTSTGVLSLSQGTAVSTVTLTGSGGSTVTLAGNGIATVTPSGPASNFTVNVPPPTFTNVGATTITGAYPNFTVTSPAASAPNLQINPPHSTSTLSANNYSINIAPTSITGSGVTGTYPSYTVNAAASPTIQINSPNTANTVAANNYSITVPNTSLTGVGVASVSGSHPAYTLTVPGPSLSITGNSISISQGTVVSTKTIAAGPWTYTAGVLYPTNNVTNDRVVIGSSSTNSNLEVVNAIGSSNGSSPVLSVVNSNSSLATSALLDIKQNSGSAAGIRVNNGTSVGDGVQIDLTNPANNGNALQVVQKGAGNTGYFEVNNSLNSARVLDLTTNGTGEVIRASSTNSLSTASLFSGSTNGISGLYITNTHTSGIAGSFNSVGTSVYASNSGNFHTIQAQNSNASVAAYAGQFIGGVNINGKTNTSFGHALKVLDNGFGELFNVRNDGNIGVNTAVPNAKVDIRGGATYTQNLLAIDNPNSANTSFAAQITSVGGGGGLGIINSSSNGNAGYFSNSAATSSVPVIAVVSSGPGTGVQSFVGSGSAFYGANNGGNPTAFLNNNGNGYALQAVNPATVATRAAMISGGLDVIGKTSTSSTFPLIINNSSSVNLFNVRDDGNVGINVPNPANRLEVLSTNSTSAIFGRNTSAVSIGNSNGVTGLTANTNSLSAGVVGQTTGPNSAGVLGESQSTGPSIFGYKGTTSGNAGRFEIGSTFNGADVIFASNSGTAAVLHTKNNVNASSGNVGVLIEEGHISSFSAATPSIGTTACTACTAPALQVYSNDIAGAFSFNMSANYGALFSYTVTFVKPYRKRPIVTITPATAVASAGNYFVVPVGVVGNYTGFTVTWPTGINGGAGLATFNYIVIESSN